MALPGGVSSASRAAFARSSRRNAAPSSGFVHCFSGKQLHCSGKLAVLNRKGVAMRLRGDSVFLEGSRP